MMSGAAPAQAVFLVGGLGTRLGALTRSTPKPLLPVAGRPFLLWLAHAVARQGVAEMLFLCGHLAPQVEAAMAGIEGQGVRVRCSVEPEPLGTGGALALARPALAEAFLLLNGDSLFAVGLAELARPGGTGALGRLALRREPDPARYGSVALDGERVTGFAEKAAAPGAPALINGGVYWLRREALDLAPPAAAFSLERDLFPRLAGRGLLEGRVFDAPFIDIGVPESLEAAQAYIPSVLSPPPG